MSATLLNALRTRIKSLTLVPSRGGCFELRVNGQLIYSKLKTGVFPDEAAMLAETQSKLIK